jgi:hypothetical protein
VEIGGFAAFELLKTDRKAEYAVETGERHINEPDRCSGGSFFPEWEICRSQLADLSQLAKVEDKNTASHPIEPV